MTAEQFHSWVLTNREKVERNHEEPTTIQEALRARLQAGLHVMDRTILEVVNAQRWYESLSESSSEETEAAGAYPKTISLIEELLSYVSDRVFLSALLYTTRAEIYHTTDRYADATLDYEKSLQLLRGSRLETDKRYIVNLVQLGGILLFSGKKAEAEKVLLDVLSYPWYLVSDAESQHFIREQYIQAGRQLIECRRGDAEALKNTVFIPATDDILGPILQAAIREAEQQ